MWQRRWARTVDQRPAAARRALAAHGPALVPADRRAAVLAAPAAVEVRPARALRRRLALVVRVAVDHGGESRHLEEDVLQQQSGGASRTDSQKEGRDIEKRTQRERDKRRPAPLRWIRRGQPPGLFTHPHRRLLLLQDPRKHLPLERLGRPLLKRQDVLRQVSLVHERRGDEQARPLVVVGCREPQGRAPDPVPHVQRVLVLQEHFHSFEVSVPDGLRVEKQRNMSTAR